MEGIQGHLCGGFSDRLGAKDTHHLTGLGLGVVELLLQLFQDNVEDFRLETVLYADLLGV